MNTCKTCKKEHDGEFGCGKFCCRSCANTRKMNEQKREKIRYGVKKYFCSKPPKPKLKLICCICNGSFEYHNNKKTCSKECHSKLMSIIGISGGKKSALIQNYKRRSKNENLLFCLLNNKYPNFNFIQSCWDILENLEIDIVCKQLKLAIDWNGQVHYLPIYGEENFKRTKYKDQLKRNILKNKNWYYIQICDMGRYNEQFVEEKFNEICKIVDSLSIDKLSNYGEIGIASPF